MGESRFGKVAELLLRCHAGEFLPERRMDGACYQLAGVVDQRFPGVLEVAHQRRDSGELVSLLIKLQREDRNARALVNAIVPLPPRRAKGELWPIRILFLSSRPSKKKRRHWAGENLPVEDYEILRSDLEHKKIQSALREAKYRDKFVLHTELAVRSGDLDRCLLDHEPDIIHFSGHGDGGTIVLERDDGSDWPVCGSELAEIFGILDGMRCVVLNACMTAKEADSIACTAGAVIAWRDAVRDRTATLFAQHFYRALADGKTIQQAFDVGCRQIEINLPCEPPELFGDSSVCFVKTGRG